MSDTDTLYAFDQCTAHALPNGQMLVVNPRNGKRALLMPDVYGALLGCRQFRTLSDHAQRLVRLNPALQGQEADVLRALESVRDDGLMIAADIYAVTLRPATEPALEPDRPVVAVITWERPEALARCLASVQERVAAGNVRHFYVVDDSRTATVQAENRAATERFAEGFGAPVTYFGAEAQASFIDALVRQVPALENQIRFLVDRTRWAEDWTSGLSRTLALLLSVGHRLVMLDDDVLCDIYEPERTAGVSFRDSQREATFYADETEWREKSATRATDPVLRHLRLLGAALPDALGALGIRSLSAADFEGAAPERLERLSGDSRVLVTECGSMGDAGSASLDWLLSLPAESLQRLQNDPEAVERAFGSRSCWVGRRQPHFSPRANMSQLTGVDNRRLVPPYCPILRGEDRLFGEMLQALHPDALVVDQPWAVAHLPIPPRRWNDSDRVFGAGLSFDAFALFRVRDGAAALEAAEPIKRLGQLARIYSDLADTAPETIKSAYRAAALERRVADYRELQRVLQAAVGAPDRWRAWLEDGFRRLDRSLAEHPLGVQISGYPHGLGEDALVGWWQDFWRALANALRAWPAIRQAARQALGNG